MVKVLGVKIDDVSLKDALAEAVSVLKKSDAEKGKPFLIVTPGPEFLLTARNNGRFREILNKADLSLPDGFGLQLYAGVKNRVPGREFMLALCRQAAENGWSIGLIGGWTGDGQKIRNRLEKKYSGIKISLVIDGDEATRIKNGSDANSYIKKPIDILFVGFGHPWQEETLWRLKAQGVKFKAGMGVGGALDYLAGRVPEPPRSLQAIGLEWLWRLVTQPRRLGRILKATLVFPFVLLLDHGKVCS